MEKISIVIPCYNASDFILQTLNSALSQDYGNYEVIAVDNESTDNTVEIIKSINNNKFKYSTAKNIYPFCWDEARTKGFETSSGRYLFTLAADDILLPEYVSRCMKYISSTPDKIKAFQSPIRGFCNDLSENINPVINVYKSLGDFKNQSLNKCMVNSPTVIYHRELFEHGLLKTKPEKYSGAADYDLSCKLADNDIFIYPGNKWLGYYYRWHDKQATWDMHREKNKVDYDKLIQEYWREKWKM